VAPAVGLLLTAAGAAVTSVGLAVAAMNESRHTNDHGVFLFMAVVTVLLMPVCVGLMVAGALRMLRGRSYLLCVVAALLAVMPWSPAWPIGLLVGIFALKALSQPEVMAAFLQNGVGAPRAPARNPEPPRPRAGKLRALWRSVAGYFLTMSPGARSQERDGKR
jgi:hypothetical protein